MPRHGKGMSMPRYGSGLAGRGVRFRLWWKLWPSYHQGLVAAHLDRASRSRRLPVGTVADIGPPRFGTVALTPPVVELVRELLRDSIVAALAILVFAGFSCGFARFVLSAKCLF